MSGEGHFSSRRSTLMVEGANTKGLRAVFGQHTTVAAADTVATGLKEVLAVWASLDSDPVLTVDRATATKSGTAGSIIIKTWMPTGATATTPVAATTFSKVVNYIAFGT